jgi:hypothetical protein
MQIEFTKEQYKNLIIANAISGWIFGILSDAIGKEYKKKNQISEELEKHLLKYAKDFGIGDFIDESEIVEGENYLDEWVTDKYIYPVIKDYVDFEVEDTISNELAWRDFQRDYTKEQIKEMEKKKGSDYFGPELYKYEKKYWDEFAKHGFSRLGIKE